MSLDVLPRELRGLRACLGCSLIKTLSQFEEEGCENCEPWLGMRGSKEAVLDCTSARFQGLIGLASPRDSWVGRWQHLTRQEMGMYAISVDGRLPGHMSRRRKDKGGDENKPKQTLK